MNAATAPIGRLTQRIQRQLRYWANSPPMAGPITAEMPHTADSQPWMRARSVTV
jgi:hypothetical protein